MKYFAEKILTITRDFTVSAIVVWRGQVLLHKHKKLGLWLPPGGHIEASELPETAAVRETLEESGVPIVLVGERNENIDEPKQLLTPRAIQLQTIYPGHEHIDLLYFAKPVENYEGRLEPEDLADTSLGWYGADALGELELTAEIRHWTSLALKELTEKQSAL